MSTIRNQANNNARSPESTCFDDDLLEELLEGSYFVVAAIGLIGILSWFEKRRDTCHTGCLRGRIGCLIHVNLLDGDRDRLAYAAAFGCTTSTIVNLLTETFLSTKWSALELYLIIIVASVGIGITYYPLFVCLAPSYRFVHSTIGIVYTIVWKYKSKIVDTIQLSYKRGRTFRYPHRVVATFTVALICLYQIAVGVFGFGTWLIMTVQDNADSNKLKNLYGVFYRYIDTLAEVAKGYVIQLVVLFIVCVCVAVLIILPIMGDVPKIFLQPFLTVLSTSAIAFVTNLLQRFVSSRWLLQDHKVLNRKSNKSETVLSLNNRKIYHNMAYFLFFFYIFIGLISCLMKMFKAIFLGVVFFGRIDRSGFMNGFETWDTGYMAYVSFLQMELVHCHPVLVVFCDQLCHWSPGNIHVPMHGTASSTRGTTRSRATFNDALVTSSSVQRYGTSDEITSNSSTVSKYNRRIHNRWLKVYTLIKNPSLVVKHS